MKKSFKKRLLTELVIAVTVFIVLQGLISVGVIRNYWQGILITICINIILAVSLNLVSGFLGELALGHAGFMAVGAYGAAWFTKSMGLVAGPEFILGLLFGGVLAMILGYIVSIPSLRLRGDYLAIITLAFGEIVRNVLTNFKALGGAAGYSSIPNYTNFANAYICMVIIVLLIVSLINSRQGRSIISIREDQIASEASGIDTGKYKKMAFVISAFFCGIGGGLYAHYISYLQPSVFNLDKSIEILVMCVLGGMGNIPGTIISAGVLTILPEVLRPVADYRMLIYAVVLIVMMLIKNNGRIMSMFASKKKEVSHE